MRTAINTILLVVLAACASTNLSPIGSEGKFLPEGDEQEAWQDSKRLEETIEKSGLLYKDQELEEYLNALADKLVGKAVRDAGVTPRVRVIQNPLLNAFALPNGSVYVHTGMLARMENEAQLATVLGHELTHVTHRHAIKEMRVVRSRAAYANAAQILLAAATGVGDLSGRSGELWALASVRGYSRELETEADDEGLRSILANGYDLAEAPKIFRQLQQDLDENKVTEPFFFGTHPALQDRIDHYQLLLRTEYAPQARETGRRIGAEEFLKRTEPLLLDNAVLDLRIGRTGTARASIDKYLKRRPDSARAHFLLGEAFRRGPDISQAIASYREAVRLDPAYAEPHRELGLIYRAQNRVREARAEFTRYLALSPGAKDGPIIRGYLAESDRP